MTWQQFIKSAQAAADVAKKASCDDIPPSSAPNATDPNCQGEVSIPDMGDGGNREKLNLPTNSNNFGTPDKLHNVCDVTKPNGTGQGEYPKPINGTARDEAVNSFTAPLDKLAAGTPLAEATAALKAASNTSDNTAVSPDDLQSPDLIRKLASIGSLMLGSERGQQAVADAIEREAGTLEAQQIINETTNMMYNQQQYEAAQYQEAMDKAAAFQATHAGWLDQMGSMIEKQAYMAGAQDGEAVAQAAMAGEDAMAPGMEGDISPEEVLERIQQLVESGAIPPEAAEALLAGVQEDAADGELTDDEIAQRLIEAEQSGEIPPGAAQAIAQEIIASREAGAAEAGMPMAEPGMEVQASVVAPLMHNAANAVNAAFYA